MILNKRNSSYTQSIMKKRKSISFTVLKIVTFTQRFIPCEFWYGLNFILEEYEFHAIQTNPIKYFCRLKIIFFLLCVRKKRNYFQKAYNVSLISRITGGQKHSFHLYFLFVVSELLFWLIWNCHMQIWFSALFLFLQRMLLNT